MLCLFPEYVPLISKSYKCHLEYLDLTRADIRHLDVKCEINLVDVQILFGQMTRASLDEIQYLTRLWKAIKSPISISYHGQWFRQLPTVNNVVVCGE
jgi:hypothetical protein